MRDGNLVRLSGAIVGDGEGFAGRGGAVSFSRLRCGEWGVHSKILEGSGAGANDLPITVTPKGAVPEAGRKARSKKRKFKELAGKGRVGRA
jgi:hypothetical protein